MSPRPVSENHALRGRGGLTDEPLDRTFRTNLFAYMSGQVLHRNGGEIING